MLIAWASARVPSRSGRSTAQKIGLVKAETGLGGRLPGTAEALIAEAITAAKAGAAFVSPFVGRLDDIGHDGMALIGDIVEIFGNYRDRLATEVLVASIRHPGHVIEAARLGADVVTMPAKVLHQLIQHPLTEKGLAAFLKDWEATGQRIVE